MSGMCHSVMGPREAVGRDEWNRGRTIEVCPDGGDECGFEQGHEYCGRYHDVGLPCPICLAEVWDGGVVAGLCETDCGAKLFCPVCGRVYRDYNHVAEEAAVAVSTCAGNLQGALMEADAALYGARPGCYGKGLLEAGEYAKAARAALEARRLAIAVDGLLGRRQ